MRTFDPLEAGAAAQAFGEDGIVVDGISKAYHDLSERVFETPTPLLTRAFRGIRPAGFEDEADDDEDDEVDEEEAEEQAPVVDADQDGKGVVWALRDVSFRIPRGTAAGLVGAQGAGKTTLLRVLAGAVPPTSGRAVLASRPAPLINVGTQVMAPAVSPERNARTAAALVGVTRRELRPHLSEILDFAGVSARDLKLGVTRDRFKLAAALTLTLPGDVLLLDEPFASRDPIFRERVLERLEQRLAEGTTIVLDTDDRDALRRVCNQALWLDAGSLAATGAVGEILAAYDAAALAARASAPQPGVVRGFNGTAAIAAAVAHEEPDGTTVVEVLLELARPALTVQVGVGLARSDGVGLWFEQPDAVVCEAPGLHRFRAAAGEVPPGSYRGLVQARVVEAGVESVIGRAGVFEHHVGSTTATGPGRTEIEWEARDASWSYEPVESAY